MRYFHGGVPGLRPGDLIEPRPAGDTRHLVDGCPTCEARRAGAPRADDVNDGSLIYVTSDREYARLYANGYPRGALYVVEPIGELTQTTDDGSAPSWSCKAARVTGVYDACVVLSFAKLMRIAKKYRIPFPVGR